MQKHLNTILKREKQGSIWFLMVVLGEINVDVVFSVIVFTLLLDTMKLIVLNKETWISKPW